MFPDAVTEVLGCRRLTLSGLRCLVRYVLFVWTDLLYNPAAHEVTCARVGVAWCWWLLRNRVWWGVQSRACRPDGGRRSTVLPCSGRGGVCDTRCHRTRKGSFCRGGGGRTGFFGEEKREGRRIGKWERSERLEASKEWSSILCPEGNTRGPHCTRDGTFWFECSANKPE